ncbi:hypothetical protein QR680_006422 [Steinernema hermaphroditum]|nr:hypothetical protein QR680_006422 [Steinernema hermaphroditum]
MVNVKKAVLVKCDPAMRQLLIHLDEDRALGERFVIKDLDDTHVLVDPDIVTELTEKLDFVLETMSPDVSNK